MSGTESMKPPAARNRVRDLLGWNNPPKEETTEGWGRAFDDHCLALHEAGHIVMSSLGEVRSDEAPEDWEMASHLFRSLMDRVHLERRLNEMEKKVEISDLRWKRVVKWMKKIEEYMACQPKSLPEEAWVPGQLPHHSGEAPGTRRSPQPGRKGRSLPHQKKPVRRKPNVALLAALDEVEEIQQDMNPTKLSPTQEYIDEARSGAMYGYSGDDDADPDRR